MTNDLAFFTMSENIPYIVSGCVIIALLTVEILGMLIGYSSLFHPNVDFHADLNGNGIPDYLEVEGAGFAGWINPGQVPLMIYIVLLCTVFTVTGFAAQWALVNLTGHFISNLIVAPVDFMLSMGLARSCTNALAVVLPRDNTNAVTLDSLIGQSGPITIGPVCKDVGGQVRIMDQYGTNHYPSVYSQLDEVIEVGENVVVMDQHPTKLYVFLVRKI